jgi:RHS repeat-associated protein
VLRQADYIYDGDWNRADQRYYAVGMGRFGTPDPGGLSTANTSDPTSWNRYAYVGGDPINFGDPSGRIRMSCDDPDADSIYDGSCSPASDQWFDSCDGANLLYDPVGNVGQYPQLPTVK